MGTSESLERLPCGSCRSCLIPAGWVIPNHFLVFDAGTCQKDLSPEVLAPLSVPIWLLPRFGVIFYPRAFSGWKEDSTAWLQSRSKVQAHVVRCSVSEALPGSAPNRPQFQSKLVSLPCTHLISRKSGLLMSKLLCLLCSNSSSATCSLYWLLWKSFPSGKKKGQ